MAKPPKFKANGEPDLRGHGEGSLGTRFQSGDGRNRPGRPKRAPDEKTDVLALMAMTVRLANGRKIPANRAILMKILERALKGDQRAAEFLLNKFTQYAPPAADVDHTALLLEADAEILAAATKRNLSSEEKPVPPPSFSVEGLLTPEQNR